LGMATGSVDSVKGAVASRTLDGLQVSINLDTLDAAAYKFTSLLPASLISKLPVAIPNEQVLTLDLGTVTVSSAASPAFDDDFSTGSAPDTTDTTLPSDAFTSPSSTGSFDTGGSLGDTDDSGLGTGSTGGTATTPAATPATSAPTDTSSGVPASSITPVFSGIGSGLILLGLLLSGLMAWAYKRVDDASELVGSGCADGDPLHELFGPEGTSTGAGGSGV